MPGTNQARLDEPSVTAQNTAPAITQPRSAVVSLDAAFHALRPRQWVKNLLLFVPLAMAHRMNDVRLFLNASLAFIAMCLAASAMYVLNDMLDVEHDRRHPVKCWRPFASGRLGRSSGIGLVVALTLTAATLCLTLPATVAIWIAGYLLVATGYSLFAKRIAILDVVTLAALYTVRLLAGGAAVSIVVSAWLAAFSVFLFFSLAVLKRYSELVRSRGARFVSGRGYEHEDRDLLRSAGLASGYVSAVVLSLYVNSSQVRTLYAHPQRLWITIPLLMYWISYAWLRAHRGEVNDDPVVFTFSDMTSCCIGIAVVVAVLIAMV